jgi:alginate O-acetyltransferase complex protein AlgI
MLFNSLAFAAFLPVVFLIYWLVADKNVRSQNILLLAASWFFYGWWDWRFLLLLIGLSITNYFFGIKIGASDKEVTRKTWLIVSVIINLGILFIFKYFNFFTSGFIHLFSRLGYEIPLSSTKIVLPLGISFYIFISLSYLFDINKGTTKAVRNIFDVLLSFNFFAIILAGPIQRPSNMLLQISTTRKFDYGQAIDGLRQILWGLFTKVVIADNLAVYVDDIFLNYRIYTGSTLLIGAIFYAVQIYADFSGYSNIAIGVARLFGINLMKNFNYPYFSRDLTEFWKKWHISLTSWFRDYLFIPLSVTISYRIKSDRVIKIKTDLFIYIIAGTLTWLLTGLWHGANYTFILWGIIHGFFLIIYQWQKSPRKKFLKRRGISNDNRIIVLSESFVTLFIVLLAWIFFRATSIDEGGHFLKIMFSGSLFSIPHFPGRFICLVITLITIIYFIIEWFGKEDLYAISSIGTKFPAITRWSFYYILATTIFFFAGLGHKFIYFQF